MWTSENSHSELLTTNTKLRIQRYRSGLCCLYRTLKSVILVKIHWRKMKTPIHRLPISPPWGTNGSLWWEQSEGPCSIAMSQPWTASQAGASPNSSSAVTTSLTALQVQVRRGTSWREASSSESWISPALLSPDTGHTHVTLPKPRGLFTCAKSLGWKNERLLSKSEAWLKN